MKPVPVVIEQNISAAVNDVFLHIVPIDLSTIFTGFGPLPAVTGTREQTGGWDGIGQTRTVTLSDGSTAREKLTAYEAPKYFSYVVSNFSGSLKWLAHSAEGEWWFESVGTGTHVRWRYAFRPVSRLTRPALWLLANTLWRGYMKKALGLSWPPAPDLRERSR